MVLDAVFTEDSEVHRYSAAPPPAAVFDYNGDMREESSREKFRVAVSSLAAASLLTLLKLIIGLSTQ